MQEAELLKPRVLLSACLAGDRVRYNGRLIRNSFARRLAEHAEVLKICPEVELGLGVPRGRVILYREGEKLKLYQPSTGLSLTREMLDLAESFLGSVGEIDGALLKSRSPSCGLSKVKIYRDPFGRRFRSLGKGIFALEVLRRFPGLPAEDEDRLRKRERRERFLLLLFALAELRLSGDTEAFHRRAHPVLRVFAPGTERRLRREENLYAYRDKFLRAVRRVPTPVLKEAFGDLVPPELLVP